MRSEEIVFLARETASLSNPDAYRAIRLGLVQAGERGQKRHRLIRILWEERRKIKADNPDCARDAASQQS